VTLRPAWWVLRAWAAVQLLSLATSTDGRVDLLPRVGPPPVALGLLLVAVVVNVQIGRRRLWPGSHLSSPFPRLLLVGLNAFAVFVLLVVVPLLPTQDKLTNTFEVGYSQGTGGDVSGAGLMYRGAHVENVFPYDAEGNPLNGVQLFDQDGRPLPLARYSPWRLRGLEEVWTVTYPWVNGSRPLRNVVPLPVRDQAVDRFAPGAWTSANPPAIPTTPLAVVPGATATLPSQDEAPGDEPASEGAAHDEATDGNGRDSENAEAR
jgi:hypothetical protein